jgi:hypothetical protein
VLIFRGLQAFNEAGAEDYPRPGNDPSSMSAKGLSIMRANDGRVPSINQPF